MVAAVGGLQTPGDGSTLVRAADRTARPTASFDPSPRAQGDLSHWIPRALAGSASVKHLLLRCTQALITQMARTAVCNRHRSTEQQLCRRLLLSLDCVEGTQLTVAQEQLANILGIRGEDVTEAALKLKHAGLIRYALGKVEILDRHGLEQRSGECCAVVRAEYARLLPAPAPA